MDTFQCIHCLGTGKEFDSMSLTTGEKKYRQCSVCEGSGKVSAERSHFSQYPDVSLRKAQELMQIHGKPVEIGITENEITVLFKDNTQFVLGGFTVGYHGTGPDFTKRFLNEAGFDISKEDIAAMIPPITLLPGTEFVPSEELVFHAPSLEEAKQKAQESIPSDSRLIALQVINDGQQTTSATGRGATDELAIKDAMKWVSSGAEIIKKDIRDEFRFAFVEGKGNSEELAFKNARSRLPAGITVEEEKVIHSVNSGVEEVQAYLEGNVKKYAVEAIKSKNPNLNDSDIKIKGIECVQREHMAGPLARLFKSSQDSPGIYRVKWTAPIKVSLGYSVFKNKVANLTFRPQPVVKIIFQPATKRYSCKLCDKVFPVTNGKILVRARGNESWDSVMFMSSEQSAIYTFKHLGINLSNLSEFRKNVFVCDTCFVNKFTPAAREDVNKRALLLEQAIQNKQDHKSEPTGAIEDLGGYAELGIDGAFSSIIKLTNMATEESSWRKELTYWVLNLTDKMIENKQLSSQSVDNITCEVIVSAVNTEHKEVMNSAYMWDDFIDKITKLFSTGLLTKDQVLQLIENKESYAKQFLADGSFSDLDWGMSPEAQKINAQGVIEKMNALQKLMDIVN